MQTELIEVAIAAVLIGLVLFVIRRASIASRKTAQTARERLSLEEPAPAKRVRKRARPGEPEKPALVEAKPPEPVADEPEVAADADATAAYKAGLAKTRGGFVARL